jgi:dihydroorotate dehydrogenase electron transfer subunit
MVLKPKIHLSKIIANREIGPGIFHMIMSCSALSREVAPGQFIMMAVSEHADPLLRRPFSLCSASHETIEILYKIRGKGTSIMANWQPEKIVNFIGPLGKGFWVPENIEMAYIVAGGIGVAPLLFLLNKLKQMDRIICTKVFMGVRTADDMAMLKGFHHLVPEPFISTEDGTMGFYGLVTDLFLKYFPENTPPDLSEACLFTCGPFPMVKILAEYAQTHMLQCQLSLESRMACGVGACLGCAIAATEPPNGSISDQPTMGKHTFQYKRVCVEGPVFDSRKIQWNNQFFDEST